MRRSSPKSKTSELLSTVFMIMESHCTHPILCVRLTFRPVYADMEGAEFQITCRTLFSENALILGAAIRGPQAALFLFPFLCDLQLHPCPTMLRSLSLSFIPPLTDSCVLAFFSFVQQTEPKGLLPTPFPGRGFQVLLRVGGLSASNVPPEPVRPFLRSDRRSFRFHRLRAAPPPGGDPFPPDSILPFQRPQKSFPLCRFGFRFLRRRTLSSLCDFE
jgi:hypothetical protein